MTEQAMIRSLFDEDTGEICVQGVKSKSSKSDLRRLMPDSEEIIEREAFGRLLNKSGVEDEGGKLNGSSEKHVSAALGIDLSDLKRTEVTHGWVPPGEYVEIAGRKVPGMVYIFDSRKMGSSDRKKLSGSRMWIDVSKPVSGRDRMGLYLSASRYGEMEPANRASYLDWHANGRRDMDFHPYYRHMYFYGLEYRYLCEGISDEEAQQISNELDRLKTVYEDDRQLRSGISELMEYGEFRNSIGEPELLDIFFDIPLKLQVEISDSISDGRPLAGKQVFDWFCNSDKSSEYDSEILHSVESDFLKKFEKSYPNGLKVKPATNVLFKEFSSASGEFQLSETVKVNGRSVADIGRLSGPMDRAAAILNGIVKKSPGSESAESGNDESDSGAGDIKEDDGKLLEPTQSPENLKFIKWASEMAEGRIPCTWEQLVEKLEERLVIGSYTLQRHVFRDLVDMGFDLAPAGMYVTSARNLSDPVILFETDGEYAKDRKGENYIDKLLNLLGLGSYLYSLAELDSKDTSKNLLSLIANMEALSRKCNECDLAALRANFEYLLLVPTNERFVKLLVRESSPAVLDMYRSFAVDAAVKMDISQAKAVSSVEKIYKLFKLDPKLAYSDLHAGAYVPKAVKKSTKGGTSDLLDLELIESIRTDTEKVSNVLGSIFTGEEKQEADAANGSGIVRRPKVKGEVQSACESLAKGKALASANGKRNGKPPADATANGKEVLGSNGEMKNGISYPGLDDKHSDFMGELVLKSFWSEKAFANLAEKHGLMPGGVTEAINEWVYERYNDVLLDEHDGFHVSAAIAETMKSEIERR